MRKIGAEKIFDGHRFLENHVLLISEEGVVDAVVPRETAGDNIEHYEGVLTPGFVNCHCHLELSHMKGKVPEKTGLVDFVFKIVRERSASAEAVREAIAKAEKEMKEGGVVAVGDICNNTLTLEQKRKGNLHYYNFIEASGWLPAVSEVRFERAKGMYEEFVEVRRETGDGRGVDGVLRQAQGDRDIVNGERSMANGDLQSGQQQELTPNSIVPHAAYSVSAGLWEKIQPYFEGKAVSIHNQETRFEDEFFLEGTGDFQRMYELMKIDNSHHIPTRKSSLQSYFHKLNKADRIILVHNTFTREEDVMYVRGETIVNGERSMVNGDLRSGRDDRTGSGDLSGVKEEELQGRGEPSTINRQPPTFFCLCVNANQYIEAAMPPVELLRKNGCAIVLGTDSLASNWSLSIVDEMKTIRKYFPHVPFAEMLGWATLNGARALAMDGWLGSFEKGKKPGVVLMQENALEVCRVLF
jgi:cytosine/adenosine deaminase-related metal-dependent hydrolase